MSKLFTKSQRTNLIELFGFPQRLSKQKLETAITLGGFKSKNEFKLYWLNQIIERKIIDEQERNNEQKKEEQRIKRNEKAKAKRKELKRIAQFEEQVQTAKKVQKVVYEVRNKNDIMTKSRQEKDIIFKCSSEAQSYENFTKGYNLTKRLGSIRNVVVFEYDPFDDNMNDIIETHFVGNTVSTMKNDLKQTLHDIIYYIQQKYEDYVQNSLLGVRSPVNVKLGFIANIKPMSYIHSLKDGEVFNCFLKQMKAWSVLNEDKKTFDKINTLNKQYFDNGVKFDDIQGICDKIHCNVEVYNKLNDKLFDCKYSTGKYKTFKYVITKSDHVETYIEDMFNVSSKAIEYVDDVDQAFKDSGSAWKCYTKTKEGKLLYFFTADKVYKHSSTASFDEGKYFINDMFDVENMKFNEEYELDRNIMIKNRDETMFEFITNANHYIYEIYMTENIDDKYINKSLGEWDDLEGKYIEAEEDEINVDLSEYYAYDQNKNYMSYKNNEYYKHYEFPKTGNFEFYSVDDTFNNADYDKIISKTGFIQIDNIDYSSCSLNTKLIMERLNYFKNGGIYPTPAIKFITDHGVKYKISTVAFTNWTYKINFSEEILTNKFYNKIVGMMDMKGDHRVIKTIYNDITELQDLLYASSDKITFYSGNELWFKLPKTCVKNNCHISAYTLCYAFLGVAEMLLQVEYKDIIGVKVDCIITKRNYDNVFTLGTEIGQWKHEKKGKKLIFDCGFTNDYEPIVNKPEMKLTKYKLDYKKLNFITGEAGAGKTTRYVSTFGETDERVHNFLMCFPNNNLKAEFSKKYDCITSTYHKAFMIGSGGKDNEGVKLKDNEGVKLKDNEGVKLKDNEGVKLKYHANVILKYYANVILDEATMISLEHFEKIVEQANKYCVNLHVVGDYDMQNKKLYQLTPPEGEAFTKFDFHGIHEDEKYYVHLKENYRQGGDKEFTEFLRSCRGLTNKQIIEKLKTYQGLKRVKVDDIKTLYKNGDIV
jgi:hypothetical protein